MQAIAIFIFFELPSISSAFIEGAMISWDDNVNSQSCPMFAMSRSSRVAITARSEADAP